MSYYLACFASDIFRAVAPIAGTMMTSTYETCAPEKDMPIFAVNGTSDGIAWYGGDEDDQGGWVPFLGVDMIIDYWAEKNNLELSEVSTLPNTDPNDGSIVNHHRYHSSNSDTEVWLYAVEHGGHDWTGYDGNIDFDTSAEIWRIFSRYTQP
jgi:polyhydroxybutyrate depolymerase